MASGTPRFSLQAKLSFFLGLLSILIYANTLNNGYALDDFFVIKYNAIVTKGIKAIPEIFSTTYFRGDFISANDYYRPLSLAMFAVEYQLFDGAPFASHLINVLLFAGCVVLLFLFLDNLFEHKRTGVSFIASLLFALHPVNTEVVANIKSRDELLCFFFAFSAMYAFINFARDGRRMQLIAASLLYFLSLLSKETAITFLALFPLVFLFYRNEHTRRSWYIITGAFVSGMVFLAIRQYVLSSNNAGSTTTYSFLENVLTHAPSYGSRLATAILILGYYLKLLVIPYPLICDYSFNSFPFTHFSDIRVLLSLLAYTALIVAGVYRLIKKHKDPLAFAILFYLISLSLFTNLFFLIGTAMGERFLFFPVIGYCLAAALFIEKWAGTSSAPAITLLKNKKAAAVIIPACMLFAVVIISRNREWHDNYSLFSADVKKAPNNCRLWYNLGTVRVISANALERTDTTRVKELQEAIIDFRKAIAIYPAYDLAYSEGGSVFFQQGNYDSSEVYCKKAIMFNPKDAIAVKNLAAIFFKTKRYEQSLQLCRRSIIIIDSINPLAYRNMGNCYLKMAQYDSAVYVLKKAIVLDPSANISYEHLAIAYKLLGNMDSAGKYLNIAQTSDPGFSY